MPYRLVSADPEPELVRRITLLLLVPEGDCLVPTDGSPALSTGDVADGEHWLLDTALRVPLQTHGVRTQGVHTVAVSEIDPADPAAGLQVYGFAVGAPYKGQREFREVPLEQAARPTGWRRDWPPTVTRPRARFVLDAAEARLTQTDESIAADNLRLLQSAYLRADTPWGQSGNGGTVADWERSRRPVAGAIERDGTFLDVGCANGFLMESRALVVRRERDHRRAVRHGSRTGVDPPRSAAVAAMGGSALGRQHADLDPAGRAAVRRLAGAARSGPPGPSPGTARSSPRPTC